MSRIDVQGDLGVAATAREGGAINIHLPQTSNVDQQDVEKEKRAVVHALLKLCQDNDIKPRVEAISAELYNTRYFKGLSLPNARRLLFVAEQLVAVKTAPSVPTWLQAILQLLNRGK